VCERAPMAERVEYDMTQAESELLMAATKDAMGAAGALGGSLGSEVGHSSAGARGGAAGGRFGARFTRPRTAARVVELSQPPDAVRERARAAITQRGVVIDDPNGSGDSAVWGLVRSGVGDMMPALVRVQIEPTAAGGARVHVRATGREGLIKQAIGGRAVDRICEAIARHAP
jgi:hypothetical protein